MKKLSKEKFEQISSFILSNARPIDKALYNWYFKSGTIDDFLKELHSFQNSDGGFGNALEPDFRSPNSTNMSTTYAFQYFNILQTTEIPGLINKAIEYFVTSYDSMNQRWNPVTSEVNDYPHAIWWQFDPKNSELDSTWGNPTVEIIGYLLKYGNSFNKRVLKLLQEKMINRILNADKIEVHELQCYVRMLDINSDLNSIVGEKIDQLVINTVETDKNKWVGYVTKPSTFIASPNSRYYKMFEQAYNFELDQLTEISDSEYCWYPSWNWNSYLDEWAKVKIEIAGMISVRNLIMLHKFGRL